MFFHRDGELRGVGRGIGEGEVIGRRLKRGRRRVTDGQVKVRCRYSVIKVSILIGQKVFFRTSDRSAATVARKATNRVSSATTPH